MSTAGARLLSPEEIATRAGGEIPFLRFPERTTLFAEREMRLRQLAAGHPMRDFLLFVAEVAHAQQEALAASPALELPAADALEAAARDGAAPLAFGRHPRDPRWRGVVRALMASLEGRLASGPARDVVRHVASLPDAQLDQQADRLLGGVTLGLDLAAAPLVAAGLQVTLAHTLLATQAAHQAADPRPRVEPFGRTDDATRCPGCAQLPVASVTRIGAGESGHRYLQCAWCSLQWHMVRIKCAHCLSTKGITYQSLASRDALDDGPAAGEALAQAGATSRGDRAAVEGAGSGGRAVELECCGECGHYVKIVHMERDPNVEPVADDLATLTLDLLAAEGGLERHGHDPMLVFGDPEAAAEPEPPPGPP